MDIERVKVTIRTTLQDILWQTSHFLHRRAKPLSLGAFLVLLISLSWWLFNKPRTVVLTGEVADYRYAITYIAKRGKNYASAVDSLLTKVIETLDSQLPGSVINQFNHPTNNEVLLPNSYLYQILTQVKLVYQQTDRVFDPTVAPLAAYWRSSLAGNELPSIAAIQNRQHVVGLDYIVVNEERIKKLKEGVQISLDMMLSSCMVDIVGDFLETEGIRQYCLKINNSIQCMGYDSKKIPSLPYGFDSDSTATLTYYSHIPHRSSALLTVVYDANGIPSPLLVDPRLGWMATGTDQTIIVFADNCITAHAYAIAFQLLGWEPVLSLLPANQRIAACRVYIQAGKPAFDTSGDIDVQYQPATNEVHFIPKEQQVDTTPSDDKN